MVGIGKLLSHAMHVNANGSSIFLVSIQRIPLHNTNVTFAKNLSMPTCAMVDFSK